MLQIQFYLLHWIELMLGRCPDKTNILFNNLVFFFVTMYKLYHICSLAIYIASQNIAMWQELAFYNILSLVNVVDHILYVYMRLNTRIKIISTKNIVTKTNRKSSNFSGRPGGNVWFSILWMLRRAELYILTFFIKESRLSIVWNYRSVSN